MLGATVGYLGPAFGCCKGGAWSPGCIFGCCPAREVVDATVGSLGAVLGCFGCCFGKPELTTKRRNHKSFWRLQNLGHKATPLLVELVLMVK